MTATKSLHDLGQSIWLDNITREILDNGTLRRYIDELSVTGLTSNPTIFEKAIKDSKVRPFVLYSLRHTFLTRLGESGCDVWTLARIAGHSSIAMSSRYVHPSADRVLDAMALLGGHKTGHSGESDGKGPLPETSQVVGSITA